MGATSAKCDNLTVEINEVEAIRREQRLRTFEQGRLEHRREMLRRRANRGAAAAVSTDPRLNKNTEPAPDLEKKPA